jgi:hypothetical protein
MHHLLKIRILPSAHTTSVFLVKASSLVSEIFTRFFYPNTAFPSKVFKWNFTYNIFIFRGLPRGAASERPHEGRCAPGSIGPSSPGR